MPSKPRASAPPQRAVASERLAGLSDARYPIYIAELARERRAVNYTRIIPRIRAGSDAVTRIVENLMRFMLATWPPSRPLPPRAALAA